MREWKPQFRQGEALRGTGLAGEYTMDQLAEIPRQWTRFEAELAARALDQGPRYGMILGEQGRPMRYITAIADAEVRDKPADWETVEVPAQFYAVFSGEGAVKVIQETWAGIWREWLGTSGRKITEGPMVEFYPPGFGRGGHLQFEIWVPVER